MSEIPVKLIETFVNTLLRIGACRYFQIVVKSILKERIDRISTLPMPAENLAGKTAYETSNAAANVRAVSYEKIEVLQER